MKLATLTIRREGLFPQLVVGQYHCGAKQHLVQATHGLAIPVKYNLTVACGPVLDHRGFLFDQTMVQAWFERQGQTPSALSCEALTIATANRLMEKIARDASHCDLRGVTLQLSPAPHQASVSAHFVKEA